GKHVLDLMRSQGFGHEGLPASLVCFAGTIATTSPRDKKLAQDPRARGKNRNENHDGARKTRPVTQTRPPKPGQSPIFSRILSSFLPRLDVAGAFLTAL